jgi:hypothetical protein
MTDGAMPRVVVLSQRLSSGITESHIPHAAALMLLLSNRDMTARNPRA